MKMKICLIVSTAVLLTMLSLAGAEENFGIPLYNSASYDAQTSKRISDSMQIEAYCYQTADSSSRAIEFYKKQPGLKFVGIGDKNGVFKKGDINLTIQSPWMDMKSGKLNQGTLISIVKQVKQKESGIRSLLSFLK